MKKEVWRKIPKFENYEVSNMGRIRSYKILKGSKTNGYSGIYLYKDKKGTHFYVHRLVMLLFVGNPPKGKVVNHKDGNKLNNNLDNLEYSTLSENNFHAYKIGLRVGCKRKLTEEKVREIISLKKTNSYSFLANKYEVSQGTISQIFYGRTWKKIFDEETQKCSLV